MSFYVFAYNSTDRQPERNGKPKRSAARTAAIVAGGAGLAYGGVKLGRAAGAVEEAVKHAKLGRGKLLRRIFGFSAVGTPQSVARDRYRKQIYEADQGRAASGYHRAASAGALLGLALRRGRTARGKASLIGAAGGVAAQAATRAVSATTKDAFGERSPGGKKVDKAAPLAIAAGALVAGREKLTRRAGAIRRVMKRPVKLGLGGFAGNVVQKAMGFGALSIVDCRFSIPRARKVRAVQHGAALAGGIAAADAVTSAVFPEKKESRVDAAKHGLAKGAIYGTGLALAEPALLRALRKAARSKRVAFATISFGGNDQLRRKDNRFVDPLKVAAGMEEAYDRGGNAVSLPVQHAQVIRAAVNRGRVIHRIGSRAGNLVRDVADTAAGRSSNGRKKEWEKSWFRNAAGTAIAAGGLLAHAHAMKRNPVYRGKVTRAVRKAKGTANNFVPDLFPMAAKGRAIGFDTTAPNWDVRDERGRSARVFAPGSRRRERREKKSYERVGFVRKAAILGALAAAAGGGALGYRAGVKRATKAAVKQPRPTAPSNIVFPKFG